MILRGRVPLRHQDENEEIMNKKIKLLIIACVFITLCLFLVSCSEKDNYVLNAKEGYDVIVKFDPNGLSWDGNTDHEFLTDAYNISDLEKNENGMVEIPLIKPNDPIRGQANMYQVKVPEGQFFVGWFTQREAIVDSEGNTTYKYSGLWDDFSKKIEIDPEKSYSVDEPAVTLYAVCNNNKPVVEIYDIDNPTVLLCTYELDGIGTEYKSLTLPQWDENTGKITYKTFDSFKNALTIKGKTLDAIYLDANGTMKVENEYMHPVVVNDDATLSNETLKLYFDYKDGEWYKIYTAKQLKDNASVSGCYELMADIEKMGVWPSKFSVDTFAGQFIGNGHTIKGITIETFIDFEAAEYNFGMFKSISKDAVIKDITFDSVEATINSFYAKPGPRYALFSAAIEEGFAFDNVAITNSKLLIDSSLSDISSAVNMEIGLRISSQA